MFAAKMVTIPDVEEQTDNKNKKQKPSKPFADWRLSKGVDRINDSAPGKKSSQNGKHERGENEPHIPRLQHAALLLHHHGMQEGRSREPREEGRVLDRIPSPIAAPA